MTIIIEHDYCEQIAVKEIIRTNEGTCQTVSGSLCKNIHTFELDLITLEPVTSYEWSTSFGTIVGGNTNESFTIEIESDKIETFRITAVISNGYVTGEVSQDFTSIHEIIPICIHANKGTGKDGGEWTDRFHGYEYQYFGGISQELMLTGERIYALKWCTEMQFFVIQFGENGDEKLYDTNRIKLDFFGVKKIAEWQDDIEISGVAKSYIIYDSSLVKDLAENYYECTRDLCIEISAFPSCIIQTNFWEIKS